MKRVNPSRSLARRIGLLLAIPATLGLAGIALAQDGPPAGAEDGPPPRFDGQGPMARCHAERHAAMLAKHDTDGDGVLSRAERRAARQARRAERLAEYDKDGDGQLNRTERAAARHDRIVERFEAVNTNGDAEISPEEAQGSCSHVSFQFAAVDTDNSGSVSWSEFEASAPKRGKRGKRGHRGWRGKRGGGGPAM